MDKIETYDGAGNLIGVVDERSLDFAKAKKNEQVNENREKQLDRGMWVYGYFWDTGERGRANVSGMVAGLAAGVPLPSNFVWRTRDNINVPFTAQMLIGLGAHTLSFVNQVYGASWLIKLEIESLTTNAQVDALDINNHPAWPNGDMDGTKPA